MIIGKWIPTGEGREDVNEPPFCIAQFGSFWALIYSHKSLVLEISWYILRLAIYRQAVDNFHNIFLKIFSLGKTSLSPHLKLYSQTCSLRGPNGDAFKMILQFY